jgi:hypothetical protein
MPPDALMWAMLTLVMLTLFHPLPLSSLFAQQVRNGHATRRSRGRGWNACGRNNVVLHHHPRPLSLTGSGHGLCADTVAGDALACRGIALTKVRIFTATAVIIAIIIITIAVTSTCRHPWSSSPPVIVIISITTALHCRNLVIAITSTLPHAQLFAQKHIPIRTLEHARSCAQSHTRVHACTHTPRALCPLYPQRVLGRANGRSRQSNAPPLDLHARAALVWQEQCVERPSGCRDCNVLRVGRASRGALADGVAWIRRQL